MLWRRTRSCCCTFAPRGPEKIHQLPFTARDHRVLGSTLLQEGSMFSHRYRGNRRVLVLACGISAAAYSSFTNAQGKPEEDKPISEVVVTGSRIVRAGYDTLEPATVIS